MKNAARQMTFNGVKAIALAVLFSVSLSASAQAGSKNSGKFSEVKISNFGQIDDLIYRGAQPMEGDYKVLAALGIKTIVDLRNDPKSYAKPAAEAAGMRYVNIPMSDKDRPSEETVAQFISLAGDAANGPFYIHCAGGRHRTGLMVAVYRFNHYNWTYDQAYKEMKDYDYYSRWGHGDIKAYVVDYYQNKVAASAASANSNK